MIRNMDLKKYAETERGAAARLARMLGVHPVMVSQWISGVKAVPAERCPAIEQATDGLVTCEELRPDIPWAVLRKQSTRIAPATPTPEAA